jgi:hypothetical protein
LEESAIGGTLETALISLANIGFYSLAHMCRALSASLAQPTPQAAARVNEYFIGDVLAIAPKISSKGTANPHNNALHRWP